MKALSTQIFAIPAAGVATVASNATPTTIGRSNFFLSSPFGPSTDERRVNGRSSWCVPPAGGGLRSTEDAARTFASQRPPCVQDVVCGGATASHGRALGDAAPCHRLKRNGERLEVSTGEKVQCP